MHPAIQVSFEGARRCGYRKIGGLYLISNGERRPCGKLPLELTVCSACGAGVKPARGWTWVDPRKLFESKECGRDDCCTCPLRSVISIIEDDASTITAIAPTTEDLGPAGLLWIGESFYPTPEDFALEVEQMGFSRRISAVPRGFVAGETWVLVAHRKVFSRPCPECSGGGVRTSDDGAAETCAAEGCSIGRVWSPGVFALFRPTAIQKVVDGTEPDEEIEGILKRGIQPVKVVPVDTEGLPFDAT